MSSRPAIKPFPVIVNGNMSGNITSSVTIIDNLSMISYSYVWTGASPVGTVSVQVSNDYSKNAAGQVSNPGTWNTLPLSNVPAISGNSSNGAIDIDANAFYAIRTVYNFISGTGTLNVNVVCKVQ